MLAISSDAVKIQKITPCLWFDKQAEEAVKFHTTIFDNSRIGNVTRYGKTGQENHAFPSNPVHPPEIRPSNKR